MYYTNFYLNLGLEKIILFLIAKLNNNHTSTLYLKDLYKLKSTINQSHTYLYLNNRNFYAQTPFLEKLIDDVFKKNTNFYWKNNQIRKKRFFKNLVKKTNFLKYKHHHRIIKQSQSSRYYNIKNQTVLRKIRNQIFFKKYKKLRCNIYYKNICINSIFNLLNITNPAPSLSFFHLDENINNLKSKNNQPFIIQNTGLVLMSKINLTGNLLNNNKFKFKFKKKYFSFLAPNQLKKSILLIKSRIVISRFFYQNKKKFNIFKFNRFSHKNFLLKFTDFFKKNSLIGVTTPYFKPAHNNILDSTVFKQKGLDESFKIKEVFIPRIRFKPGYQRL